VDARRLETLELPELEKVGEKVELRERISELQALSEKAEGGDEEARKELRRAVRESTPEVVARCSDIARNYRKSLAKTASGGVPYVEEAFVRRAELLAEEVAGENPSPLESLLAERIASLWALTELQEALLSGYYGGLSKNLSPTFLIQMSKLQESTNRRYMNAIKTLAQVRKHQGGTPAFQVNTQINLG
jgi:hypothetical protein